MSRRPSPDTTIGQNIRTRRQARGWSVRYAADRAGISHTTWSRIELGTRSADNRFVLADIAAALECAVTDITGHAGPPVDRATVEAQAAIQGIRQALVDIDLSEPALCEPRPVAELERETQLVVDLRRRCDYVGAGQRLPVLLRELHAATGGRDREQALRLMVQAAAAAAGVVRYIDSPAESWLAAERGRDAARELGDPVMLGLAEYERVHAATGCGCYTRGLTLARRAADEMEQRQGPGAAELLGMLHLSVAFTALGAKQPGEVEERLAAATQLAQRTGETSTLALMFGPTNVDFWRVSMEVDAGDPERAVEIGRSTNPSLVASKSRQVAFYTDMARALSRVKRDGAAVRMLLTAERLSPARVHSTPLARETARSLIDRAQRRAGGPELRGLCERMGMLA
jgi:transcriptional regulator with XRE-family HTH domain